MNRKKNRAGKAEIDAEEKPKPIDRTQVIVAIIGLVGTLAVAVIALLGSQAQDKPAQNIESTTLQSAEAPSANASTSSPPQAQTTAPVNSNSEECVGEYFANVVPENQNSMEVGIKLYISTDSQSGDTLGPYGVQLTENGAFIGAIQFLGFTNSDSFKVTSVVDSNCAQITDFGNIDIPSRESAIDNWGNLGIHLASGDYRLRMGWYGSNQIELIFQEN